MSPGNHQNFTKKRWWIAYKFRIPEELKHLHKSAKWKVFRVFEDINRYKTDEYAELLLTAVQAGLEKGFNPFDYKERAFLEFQKTGESAPDKVWSCVEAFTF
jgi:hypothetical protein